jgi:hypothetical protein
MTCRSGIRSRLPHPMQRKTRFPSVFLRAALMATLLWQTACTPPGRLTVEDTPQQRVLERRESVQLQKALDATKPHGVRSRVQRVSGRIAVIVVVTEEKGYFEQDAWKIWHDIFAKNNPAAEYRDCVGVAFADRFGQKPRSGQGGASNCPRF